MKITLDRGDCGTYAVLAEDGRDVLFQTDWDFPGLASTFGWISCECGATDGTVDCPHKNKSDMMASAWDFLNDHIGATAEDPGYFS